MKKEEWTERVRKQAESSENNVSHYLLLYIGLLYQVARYRREYFIKQQVCDALISVADHYFCYSIFIGHKVDFDDR